MNISRPLTDADLIRKAERSGERFLAAQALHDGWAGAKSYGLPRGVLGAGCRGPARRRAAGILLPKGGFCDERRRNRSA